MNKEEKYKDIAIRLALTGSTMIKDPDIKASRCDNGSEKQNSKEFVETCRELSKILQEKYEDEQKAWTIMASVGMITKMGITETPEMMGMSNMKQMLSQLQTFAESWNNAENILNELINKYTDTRKIEDTELIDWYNAIEIMKKAGNDLQETIKGIMERKGITK